MEFVKNDLAYVPKDRLVFIAMHIPLPNVVNREELFRLIEDRPHTFSCSAHTHVQDHHFLDAKDGWNGKEPHHHLNHATVCGSWWEGALDERGIPHATMSDGAPNGFSIVEFEENRYKVSFRAASRPSSHQMNIWMPEEIASVDSGKTEITVNVYAGSTRSRVEMRVAESDWIAMANVADRDPYFVQLKEMELGPKPPTGMKLPNPSKTKHLWKATLPAYLPTGTHAVEVRATDMFGQVHFDRRILRVV
ncbi:MAG: calcineurin-like phosphoesterase C-terminal domain-containing protein [Fimbriimonadaceae bacterium]|nr:calcineurin-like phosphoesterase C-terminal domain-containing protein [Fimbriimonadaceae bacterium]